ncbi:HIT family protein [Caulobacter mirabilis]|uniref:Diadenosine tetraphosphate hydrolase n=1 Tax=Caulobacter mirabilis TaxID=69666 RepID=A0A2D2B2M7_9CAUL|nr:HIT domain-containing protein [Caulobacter mirabilis]ATQ44488.1 diadenosine tetraphosphate hydrolase [Caulobacter mirabilis]
MSDFTVDPAFEGGSVFVGDTGLCHIRLQNDVRWPWLILIPRRAGLREIEDLSPADRAALIEESVLAGRAVRGVGEAIGFSVEKLNLGALGNVTPQLHLHVVGRRAGDPAWAGPVWGVGTAEPYGEAILATAIEAVRRTLGVR